MSGTKRKAEGDASASRGEESSAVKKIKIKASDLASMDPQVQRIIKARVLVKKRDAAREEGDFEKSDEIRSKLVALGVETIDQKGGPSGWRFTDGSSKKLPAGFQGEVPSSASKPAASDAQQAAKPKSAKSDSSSSAAAAAAAGKDKKDKKEKASTTPESQRNKAVASSILNRDAASGTQNVQGVLITDNVVGTGARAQRGHRVKVHYIGKLKSNGRVFDKSNKPFAFTLGRGEVIRGWDIGVDGMQIGGKRNLVIPAHLAYGKSGAPPTIPPNATLIFDVQLLETR